MAGSVINRGNDRWELRISRGYSQDGKQIRLTKRVTATSRRAAEKKLDDFFIATLQENVNHGEMKFVELVALWLEKHNAKLSLTTRETQKRLVEGRMMDAFGGMQLKNIDAALIEKFIDNLKDSYAEGNRKKARVKLSESTVFKHFKLLNHMLGKAVDWKIMQHNPCDDIPVRRRPKPHYEHYKIWQEAYFKKFIIIIEEMK